MCFRICHPGYMLIYLLAMSSQQGHSSECQSKPRTESFPFCFHPSCGKIKPQTSNLCSSVLFATQRFCGTSLRACPLWEMWLPPNEQKLEIQNVLKLTHLLSWSSFAQVPYRWKTPLSALVPKAKCVLRCLCAGSCAVIATWELFWFVLFWLKSDNEEYFCHFLNTMASKDL